MLTFVCRTWANTGNWHLKTDFIWPSLFARSEQKLKWNPGKVCQKNVNKKSLHNNLAKKDQASVKITQSFVSLNKNTLVSTWLCVAPDVKLEFGEGWPQSSFHTEHLVWMNPVMWRYRTNKQHVGICSFPSACSLCLQSKLYQMKRSLHYFQ